MNVTETQPRTTEAPAIETIKLSEAMREGAKLRKQMKGLCFFDGKTCALGAAYEGLTGKVPTTNCEVFRFLREHYRLSGDVTRKIWEWNDLSGYTREQIADILESVGL